MRRRDDGSLQAVAGPDRLVLRTPIRLRPQGRTHARRGNDGFYAELGRLLRGCTQSHRSLSSARTNRTQLDRLVAAGRGRRAVVGGGDPVLAHITRADFSVERGNCRRAHHVAPGTIGRLPQLGLPILLAARRDLHSPINVCLATRCRASGISCRWPWISRTLMPRAYIDTIFETGKPALIFGDQLRVEGSRTIARDRNFDLRGVRCDDWRNCGQAQLPPASDDDPSPHPTFSRPRPFSICRTIRSCRKHPFRQPQPRVSSNTSLLIAIAGSFRLLHYGPAHKIPDSPATARALTPAR